MKVKELIKQLQKCNPESYIRTDGGVIKSIEEKEGYWDGAYKYIDWDKNKMITSEKGSKVDFSLYSTWDFVEFLMYTEYKNRTDGRIDVPTFEKFFERHFVHESLSVIKEQREEKLEYMKDEARNAFTQLLEIFSEFDEIYIDGVKQEYGNHVLNEENIEKIGFTKVDEGEYVMQDKNRFAVSLIKKEKEVPIRHTDRTITCHDWYLEYGGNNFQIGGIWGLKNILKGFKIL